MTKKQWISGSAALLLFHAAAEVYSPVQISASSHVNWGSKYQRNTPDLTADGKIGTKYYWVSDVKNKVPPPHWVEFDFGRSVSINTIKLDFVALYNLIHLPENFKVEYFDGKVYRLLAEKKNYKNRFFTGLKSKDPKARYAIPTPDSSCIIRFPAVTATRVRYVTNDWGGRLDEMSVSNETTSDVQPQMPQEKKIKRSWNHSAVQCYSFAPECAVLPDGFQRAELKCKGQRFSVDRKYPDPIRRYFNTCRGEFSFEIPVKHPGWYRLFLMGGDLFTPTEGSDLVIAGKKIRIPSAPAGDFPWEIATVKADQKIQITSSKKGGLLNTVILAPIEENTGFDKAVLEVMKAGCTAEGFKHLPQITHTVPPKITDKDRKRGFLSFTPSLQERIFENTTPRPNQICEKIIAQGAGNSWKACTVAFHALRDIPDFKVEYTGKIKAEVHPIRNWVQRTGSKVTARTYAVLPEVLESNTEKFLQRGRTLQYYLIFEIPRATAAGAYDGKLKISGEGIDPMELPIAFTVFPFDLDKVDDRLFTALWASFDNKTSPESPVFLEKNRVRMKDLRKHNINSVIYPKVSYYTQEKFEKGYLALNRLLDECEFPRFPIPYYNTQLTKKQITEIQEVVRRHGKREILFYLGDEPIWGRQHLAKRKYAMCKSVPGARTFCTVTQKDIDLFGSDIDFRTYQFTDHSDFNLERILRECKRDEAALWLYSNISREYPDCARYKAEVFQWSLSVAGFLNFAYDEQYGDLWNDLDNRDCDCVAVYMIDGKIHSTIQWKGLREGLDDFRYLMKRENLIRSDPKSVAAKSGRTLLVRIRTETVSDPAEIKKRYG